MKTYKKLRIFLLSLLQVLLPLLITGCWSSKPIDELNFIVGTALDQEEDGKIRSTLQYVIPEAMGAGKNDGKSTAKPYINVSETGVSLEPTGWETTIKREGIIFGAHEKVVIISEDLAREKKLQQLTDLYYRDIDIRGSTLIFISKGRADKTLELKEANIIPSLRMAEIATHQSTTRVLPPISLTMILGKLISGSSFLIQSIESKNGEISFEGAAIIKGKTNKLVGFFNKKDLEGINWLTGQGKGGAVKAYNKNDKPIFYQVESMKSKIIPKVKGGRISFDVTIESEGRIAEYWNPFLKPAFENKNVKKIEKTAEKEVKRLVVNVMKKMQKEYQVDVAGFGNELRIKYPKVWAKEKKDWDNKFSEIPIKYNIQLTIKDYGMIGTKKGK